MSPIISGGDPQPVLTATVTLTNAQIKTLRATPVILASPSDANHAVMPRIVSLVLDDTHGVYTDADGSSNASIGDMPTPTTGVNTTTFSLDNVGLGSPGVGVYPTALSINFAWGLLESGGAAPAGALGLGKLGAAEYAGGGAGNTLTIVTSYIAVPLT